MRNVRAVSVILMLCACKNECGGYEELPFQPDTPCDPCGHTWRCDVNGQEQNDVFCGRYGSDRYDLPPDGAVLGAPCDPESSRACAGAWRCKEFDVGLECVVTREQSVEQCDGVDNDCDGRTDEPYELAIPWPEEQVLVCRACDDTNGADCRNQCNVIIDREGERSDCRWWCYDNDSIQHCRLGWRADCLIDADSDGWYVRQCLNLPTSYFDDLIDCDDSRSDVQPGPDQALEVCDEVDNNCDGVVDDGTCQGVCGTGTLVCGTELEPTCTTDYGGIDYLPNRPLCSFVVDDPVPNGTINPDTGSCELHEGGLWPHDLILSLIDPMWGEMEWNFCGGVERCCNGMDDDGDGGIDEDCAVPLECAADQECESCMRRIPYSRYADWCTEIDQEQDQRDWINTLRGNMLACAPREALAADQVSSFFYCLDHSPLFEADAPWHDLCYDSDLAEFLDEDEVAQFIVECFAGYGLAWHRQLWSAPDYASIIASFEESIYDCRSRATHTFPCASAIDDILSSCIPSEENLTELVTRYDAEDCVEGCTSAGVDLDCLASCWLRDTDTILTFLLGYLDNRVCQEALFRHLYWIEAGVYSEESICTEDSENRPATLEGNWIHENITNPCENSDRRQQLSRIIIELLKHTDKESGVLAASPLGDDACVSGELDLTSCQVWREVLVAQADGSLYSNWAITPRIPVEYQCEYDTWCNFNDAWLRPYDSCGDPFSCYSTFTVECPWGCNSETTECNACGCRGAICGFDNCGNLCGECNYDERCQSAQCVPATLYCEYPGNWFARSLDCAEQSTFTVPVSTDADTICIYRSSGTLLVREIDGIPGPSGPAWNPYWPASCWGDGFEWGDPVCWLDGRDEGTLYYYEEDCHCGGCYNIEEYGLGGVIADGEIVLTVKYCGVIYVHSCHYE